MPWGRLQREPPTARVAAESRLRLAPPRFAYAVTTRGYVLSTMSAVTFRRHLPDPDYQPARFLSRSRAVLSRLHPVPSRRRDALAETGIRAVGECLPGSVLDTLDYRLTVRAQMALQAVRARPGLNNLELSEIIGLSHHSQTSRMMRRLQTQGLVENSQTHTNRHVKSWRLTIDGQAVLDAHGRTRALRKAQRKARKSLKLATVRRPAAHSDTSQPTTAAATVSATFRMTALSHEVLTAAANLSVGGSQPSNRDIAQAAGGRDEGHISKVLRRLEQHGFLQNSGPVTAGAPKAWSLTPRGKDLLATFSGI